MSKHWFYIIALCITLFLFSACQELFYPTLETSQDNYLVVEGKLSNTGSSTRIRLTKAIGYNAADDEYNSSFETAAEVSITDDFGNAEILHEIGEGYYEAAGFIGYVGRTYTLKIITSDGSVYESNTESMQPPLEDFSLFAEFASRDVKEITPKGETQFVTQYGVNLYFDLKTNENATAYYKIDTRVIREEFHLEWRYGRCSLCPSTSVYCWTVGKLDDKPVVKESTIIDGTEAIKHYNLGFIQEGLYVYVKDDVIDPPMTMGNIITCNVSSISEKEFLYYSKLREQLSANNKIFDPLPIQPFSNIKCTTDESKVVLGYFSVSSQFKRDYFVKYNRGDQYLHQRYEDNVPEYISAGCTENYKPNFWLERY